MREKRRIMNQRTSFFAMLAFGVIGLLTSTYLTYLSMMPPTSCPIGEFAFLSCNEVIYSTYAKVFGVSVAVLGLDWFVVALGLILLAQRSRRFRYSLVAWSLLGTVGVTGFVYTEVFLVGALCPFCTIAHAMGIAVLILSLLSLRNHASNLKP
jgi:uncharacterized membrane protein